MSASLRPLTQNYKAIAATISTELQRLADASDRLQHHNARLLQQERKTTWLWQALLALVLFLAGGLCGNIIEKRLTRDVLRNVGAQIERLPATAPHNSKFDLQQHQIR